MICPVFRFYDPNTVWVPAWAGPLTPRCPDTAVRLFSELTEWPKMKGDVDVVWAFGEEPVGHDRSTNIRPSVRPLSLSLG